jgi:tetratricopeptide (TPR) repeat protein
LVEALLGQGDVQAGVDSAREWLALDPENLHLRQYLGDTLFREGRYEDALAEYEGIIEARPTAALGYIKTGDALVAMKREAEASQLYAVADRLEPGNLATAMRIIESASAAGDLKTAAQAFKQARSKSSPSANQDQQKAENEHYYQLLCRWRAQALANGDDEQEREVAELLASVYVDGGGAYGTRYALRAAFVPDSISPDQVVDFRVVEPGGNVVSSIMPYNSALGSQLISYSKTGGAPRVYWLPSYDKGSFQFEISYESAQGTKPLLGKLYLHRIPRSGLEYWEQYELRLDRVGAREQLTISIDDVPKAAVFAPTR